MCIRDSLSPVLLSGQFAGHVEAERVVLGGKDDVEQEQLTDRVADVEHLGDEEQHHQIVAESVSSQHEIRGQENQGRSDGGYIGIYTPQST